MSKPSKTSKTEKLTLHRETLQTLTSNELRLAAGGAARRTAQCN